jgi:hypothetical protein
MTALDEEREEGQLSSADRSLLGQWLEQEQEPEGLQSRNIVGLSVGRVLECMQSSDSHRHTLTHSLGSRSHSH